MCLLPATPAGQTVMSCPATAGTNFSWWTSTMYKPYLSRQKSGKSVQTRVSAGDKTTLKLVTEQLRASQKVLNKSDQFIPSWAAWRGSPAQSAPSLRPTNGRRQGWTAHRPVPHTHHTRDKSAILKLIQSQKISSVFCDSMIPNLKRVTKILMLSGNCIF